MSHKESAIPAGCFYSPSSPTMSSNPASPVSPSLPAILADQNLPGPFVDFVQSEPFTVSGLHLQTTDDSRKPDIPRSTPAEENETPVHTVRRKFFSPLERLRSTRKSSSSLPRRSARRQRTSTPDSCIAEEHVSPQGRAATARQLQHSASIRRRPISQADAEWFLNLPEKIRTKHFTREEQTVLSARCESVVLASADGILGKKEKRKSANLSSPSNRSSIRVRDTVHESMRWMDEDNLDLRLTFDDYVSQGGPNSAVAALSSIKRGPSVRRSSGRRHVRLASKPLGALSQASVSQTSSPRSLPKQSMTPTRRSETHDTALDSEAAYYRDPEARMKLRQYLVSPQKFDEAVEFGFPSSDGANKENITPQRSRASLRRSDITFYNEEDASLSDLCDESSVPDSDVPLTPSDLDTPFRSSHRLPTTSIDSIRGGKSTPTREMTLRMTLTRPELRADEVALYGWQGRGKGDPLSLAELPTLADETNGMGAFAGSDSWAPVAKDEGVVMKLLRRMKPSPKW